MFAVSPKLPVKSFQEFLALAKSKPGELTYGTTGAGGTQHMATLRLEQLAGIEMLHVPYSGGSGALNDLIAGVIERYGEPEERMAANYRRYVREYPLVGQALRSMAAEGRPALIHCVNGKDRTGVLCATLLRATGADEDAIMEDYLRVNTDHADLIAEEAAHLDGGMTDHERAILLSFLEARPAYLRAYFDEIDRLYGSFATYLREGLHLTNEAIESLRALVA